MLVVILQTARDAMRFLARAGYSPRRAEAIPGDTDAQWGFGARGLYEQKAKISID
jgi:hypothetical protein